MKELFKKWLSGTIVWKEEKTLRRLAQKDAFLKEAMEGYEAFPSADYDAIFENLKNKIGQKKRRSNTPNLLLWRVAAAAAMLVGAFYMFFWIGNQIEQPDELGEAINPITEEHKPIENQVEESLLEEEPLVYQDVNPNDTEPTPQATLQPKSKRESKKQSINATSKAKPKLGQIVESEPEQKITRRLRPTKEMPNAIANVDKAPPISINSIQETPIQQESQVVSPSSQSKVFQLDEAISSNQMLSIRRQPTELRQQRRLEPRPEGGFLSFERYLQQNLTEDNRSAVENEWEVDVHFFINEQGRPTNLSVREDIPAPLKVEAIRLIVEGPNWKPHKVEASYTIVFKAR